MRAGILAGIVLAIGPVACGKEPSPAPASGSGSSAPAAGTPASPKGASPAAALSRIKVVLLEPGAEPRTALRYRLTAGSKASYEMTQTQKNRTGDSPHLTVQTTITSADVEVLSADAAGQASARVTMHDVRAEILGTPGAKALDALAGFQFHLAGRISPLGGWTDTEFAVDKDPTGKMKPVLEPMMDSMGQMMGQISVQFPSEPVGAGAQWKAEGPVKVLGMTISSTTIVTVESIGEGRVVLRQKASADAKDQRLEMPPVTGDVLEISTKGEGKVTIDLTRVLPDEMEMNATVHSKMRIKPGPDAVAEDLEISGTQEMRIKRKE